MPGAPKLGSSVFNWKPLATEVYEQTGSLAKAAKAAQKKRREIVAAMADDAEFRLDMEDAKESWLDGLEEYLGKAARGEIKGNPLAAFGPLKAHRTDKYHDKAQAQVLVQVNQPGGPSEETIAELFRASLRDATEVTRSQLALPADGENKTRDTGKDTASLNQP